jgi:hypothetical protein
LDEAPLDEVRAKRALLKAGSREEDIADTLARVWRLRLFVWVTVQATTHA